MALKNTYTQSTQVFTKIQAILISHKARHIGFEYEDDGKIKQLTFSIEFEGKIVPVSLPARVDNVAYLMYRQSYANLPQSKQDQAYRTAWANIRDWLDAQMALIDTQQVKLEEVFLPYMIDNQGQTFFEYAKQNLPLLGGGRHD